ncbi:MAG: hypothetical protein IJ374_12730 [Lachnospiraceae bacterium]|nr:hypothetical protein [Lachnospiraceae bacterium]
MSKKKTGLLIAFGAVLGAAAAGISYYLKYKSFNDEIDKDFHDYEDDETLEEKEDEAVTCTDTGRTYITIDSGKGKSCESTEACEEETPEECPAAEEPAAAATVEEDTEGAN